MNRFLRPHLSESRPKNSAPATSPSRYHQAMLPLRYPGDFETFLRRLGQRNPAGARVRRRPWAVAWMRWLPVTYRKRRTSMLALASRLAKVSGLVSPAAHP